MRNTSIRVTLGVAALLFAVKLPSFIEHARFFLSGEVGRVMVQQHWWLVLVNIGLFLAFLLLLHYRKPIDWAQAGGIGVYTAFIVSLFVEMYGVPLTIFLGSGVLNAPLAPPNYIFSLTVFGTTLAMNLWMVVGAIITLLGMAIVAIGWYQVYTAHGLKTDGLYAYSRNPQYVGIILIAFGWVVGWPSILTLGLFPLLVAAYIHLARREQADMLDRYGEDYATYKTQVPLLV